MKTWRESLDDRIAEMKSDIEVEQLASRLTKLEKQFVKLKKKFASQVRRNGVVLPRVNARMHKDLDLLRALHHLLNELLHCSPSPEVDKRRAGIAFLDLQLRQEIDLLVAAKRSVQNKGRRDSK